MMLEILLISGLLSASGAVPTVADKTPVAGQVPAPTAAPKSNSDVNSVVAAKEPVVKSPSAAKQESTAATVSGSSDTAKQEPATSTNAAIQPKATASKSAAAPTSTTVSKDDAGFKPIQVYSQDELLDLIAKNHQLRRVKADDCQLVQDIQARASVAKIPSYQFLWGDMLAHGVCVKTNVIQGLNYLQKAADQGLPEAMEQLGRYYATGQWVQHDYPRAMALLRMATRDHNIKAALRFADLASRGHGIPQDKALAYRVLKDAVITDRRQHYRAALLIKKLQGQLPPSVLANLTPLK